MGMPARRARAASTPDHQAAFRGESGLGFQDHVERAAFTQDAQEDGFAAADLGVAMGAKGAAASAEAADVVILVDRLDRILPAIAIAKRARRIALQSVYVGLGLSLVGMVAAALGFLAPIEGALLQEAIDLAVILNALRVLAG